MGPKSMIRNIIYQHDSEETLSIRDPETRANSEGRTNGTSHLTEVADAEDAEKEEVHTLNFIDNIYNIWTFEHIKLNKFWFDSKHYRWPTRWTATRVPRVRSQFCRVIVRRARKEKKKGATTTTWRPGRPSASNLIGFSTFRRSPQLEEFPPLAWPVALSQVLSRLALCLGET